MHLRSAIALTAAVCAIACAPSTTLVAVIGVMPPDDYASDPLPHDAFDAMEAAAQMPVSPEAMIPVYGFLASSHRRIHKSFVDRSLPAFEQVNATSIAATDFVATIEVAIGRDGQACDMKIARSSGLDAFDASALSAIVHASPFDSPPAEIIGGNQEVRLSWRLHRYGEDPCALSGAAILKADNP